MASLLNFHMVRSPERSAYSAPDARRRSRRVLVLLAAIVVLSLADLTVTLAHLRSTGMMEANPIAVYLIRSTRSPWALGGLKLVSVTVCISLLYVLRHRVQSEIAAWCAVLILVVMTMMWHNYAHGLDAIDQIRLTQAVNDDENWVLLD